MKRVKLVPRYPAAVAAGNVETSQAITDTLFGAIEVATESREPWILSLGWLLARSAPVVGEFRLGWLCSAKALHLGAPRRLDRLLVPELNFKAALLRS